MTGGRDGSGEGRGQRLSRTVPRMSSNLQGTPRRAKGLVLRAPSGHARSSRWERQDGESLPRQRHFYQQSGNLLVASKRMLPNQQG